MFKLPNHVQESIYELEQSTKFNTGFQVNICLSYGGRADILQACRKVTSDVVDHKICAEDITEQYFSNKLTTSGFAGYNHMVINFKLIVISILNILLIYFLSIISPPFPLCESNLIYSIVFHFMYSITCAIDPDIMIRTSGEYRISNFLIWQVISV